MAEEEDQKKSYGKRPLWQWIVLYAVVAIVLYGAFYYFFIAKKGGYNNESSQYQTQQNTSQTTPEASPSGILTTKTDSTKGDYLADSKGMTLYLFDKDTPGVTNCYDSCATTWPPYVEGATPQSSMPADVTVVTRTDGSMQYAYKGRPLYYFAKDKQAGDTTGDGVGGVWHIVKP